MELLLIRHATAHKSNAIRWRNDRLRPLSPTGIKKFKRAVAGVRQFCKAPAVVFSSPLTRARQTADLLSDYADWPKSSFAESLSPMRPVEMVLGMLALNGSKRIALVGHEPHLGKLLRACIAANGDGDPAIFKKGAIACIRFEGRARAGHGKLQWLLTPAILRRLAK